MTRDCERACIPLGLQSDVAALLRRADADAADKSKNKNENENENADPFTDQAMRVMLKYIEAL